MLIIMLFPRVSNYIVPLFKSVCIWLQIGMLAPSFEAKDAIEAFSEAFNDAVGIFFGVGTHLKPVLLNAGHNRLILYLSWDCCTGLTCGLFFLTLFGLFWLQF
jgi:hypothetical protein